MHRREMSGSGDWERLASLSHLPEMQEILRREILEGRIRVIPTSEGSIRIVPVDATSPPPQAPEPRPEPEPEYDRPPRRPVEFGTRAPGAGRARPIPVASKFRPDPGGRAPVA